MLKRNEPPVVGELALDATCGRVGVVMDAQGGRVFLRRPEGGREWEVSPEDVRPVPSADRARFTRYPAGAGQREVRAGRAL